MALSTHTGMEDRILAAATEMFMSIGFKRTSTRAIARQVGITQPNLYHYFPNKEALYLAVIGNELQQLNHDLSAILEMDIHSLDEALREVTLILLNYDKVDYMSLHFDMIHSVSEPTRKKMYTGWEEKMLVPITQIFAQYKADLPKEMSEYELAQLYFGQMATMMRFYPHLDNNELAVKFIHLFLHGIMG